MHCLEFKTKPLSFLVNRCLGFLFVLFFCLPSFFQFKVYRPFKCFHHNTERTRDELREQVYEAMSEKSDSQEGEPKVNKEEQVKEHAMEAEEAPVEDGEGTEAPVEDGPLKSKEQTEDELDNDVSSKRGEAVVIKDTAEQDVPTEQSGNEQAEPMEEAVGGRCVRAHECKGEEMGLVAISSLGEYFLVKQALGSTQQM